MKKFLLVDLTGRGYNCEYNENELSELQEQDEIDDGETICDWSCCATVGEEYNNRTFKIICISNE